jgi:hypothetical protein
MSPKIFYAAAGALFAAVAVNAQAAPNWAYVSRFLSERGLADDRSPFNKSIYLPAQLFHSFSPRRRVDIQIPTACESQCSETIETSYLCQVSLFFFHHPFPGAEIVWVSASYALVKAQLRFLAFGPIFASEIYTHTDPRETR